MHLGVTLFSNSITSLLPVSSTVQHRVRSVLSLTLLTDSANIIGWKNVSNTLENKFSEHFQELEMLVSFRWHTPLVLAHRRISVSSRVAYSSECAPGQPELQVKPCPQKTKKEKEKRNAGIL